MFQRRVVGLVLAAFAIVLIAFSLLSHRWWTMKDDNESVMFGLRSVEMCEEDYDDGRTREECRSMSLGKMFKGEADEKRSDYDSYGDDDDDDRKSEKEPSGFLLLGNLTFFGGIAAGALLLICAGAVLMNAHARGSNGLGTATAVASAVYAGAGLLTVFMAPDELKDVPLGLALPLALIGGGCGLFAGLVLGKYDPGLEPRPIPSATAMLQGMAPSKVPSIVLAGIGLVLTMGAVFTNTWWGHSEDDDRVSVGVREAESCMKRSSSSDYDSYDSDRRSGEERCQTQILYVRERFSDYDDGDQKSLKRFIKAGAITYHAGIMACVLTMLAGVMMLSGQKLRGPVTPAHLAIGFTGIFLLAAIVFIASKPSEMKEMNASFGPVLALAGGGCLIGAGIAIMRFIPTGMTVQPQMWLPPGMPMGPMGPIMGGPIMGGPIMGGPIMGGPLGPLGPQQPHAPMGMPYAPLGTTTPVPGSIPQMQYPDVRSGPVTPACPQCAAPMVFMPQHGRWFCGHCRVYA